MYIVSDRITTILPAKNPVLTKFRVLTKPKLEVATGHSATLHPHAQLLLVNIQAFIITWSPLLSDQIKACQSHTAHNTRVEAEK